MFRGFHFYCICLAVASGAVPVTALPAGAELLLDQSRVDLTVSPGETVTGKMHVYNTGPEAEDIRVYWQDFEYISPYDGEKLFSAPGTSAFSLGDWISYAPQVLTVPPEGKREIRYTLKVPEETTGGHYGVLFFERALTQGTAHDTFNGVARTGSLFFVDPVDSDKTAAVEDLRVQDEFVRGRFVNHGNVCLFPRGQYFVRNANGDVVDRGETEMMYVMPGGAGDFALVIAQDLAEGDFELSILFDLGEGKTLHNVYQLTKFNAGQYHIQVPEESVSE